MKRLFAASCLFASTAFASAQDKPPTPYDNWGVCPFECCTYRELTAGDVIYMLSPLGEGFYLFWYKGQVYKSGIPLSGLPLSNEREASMTWWKLVRNRAGRMGWTKSDKFSNADACG